MSDNGEDRAPPVQRRFICDGCAAAMWIDSRGYEGYCEQIICWNCKRSNPVEQLYWGSLREECRRRCTSPVVLTSVPRNSFENPQEKLRGTTPPQTRSQSPQNISANMDKAELEEWLSAPVSQDELGELAQVKAINRATMLAAPGQTVGAAAKAHGIALSQGSMSTEAFKEMLDTIPRAKSS